MTSSSSSTDVIVGIVRVSLFRLRSKRCLLISGYSSAGTVPLELPQLKHDRLHQPQLWPQLAHTSIALIFYLLFTCRGTPTANSLTRLILHPVLHGSENPRLHKGKSGALRCYSSPVEWRFRNEKSPLRRRISGLDIFPHRGLNFAPFLADGCGWSIGSVPFASPLSGYVSLQLYLQPNRS
jgi:hypothetical protein